MATTSMQPTVNPMKAVLRIRDFLLLWLGQATSMLGDQFHSIAAAWLVLKMTGDPLALGTVMAVGGIPRAIFIVIGGAITDRFSPRKVMLASDIIRFCLSTLLAIQVFTGTLQVWMIYIYALVSGIVGGFFGPAAMSIVPRILSEKDLQAGNSLSQGSSQLIGFVGPAIAGGMIAAFTSTTTGVGVAMVFDAVTFVVSIVTLWLMQTGGTQVMTAGKLQVSEVLSSVKGGISYMVKDPVLRLLFIIIAIANLAFGGPIIVGVPYLANIRFPEGAAAYGIIISGYSGGNLLGLILSGALPRLSKKIHRVLLVALFTLFGLGVTALGWINLTWLATTDLFVMGVLNGYLSITLITGIQRSTPKELLGRLMSMILLANMSLMPLSQAIAGIVLRWNTVVLFAGAGAMLLILAVFLLVPEVNDLAIAPLSESEAA